MSTLNNSTDHIQIFNKKRYKRDFIQEILNHKKTFDMRFLNRRITPYNKLKNGDTVYLKESGGLIIAKYTAVNVKHLELEFSTQVRELFEKYRARLAINDELEFERLILERDFCKYVTYYDIVNPILVSNIFYKNRFNISSWVTLTEGSLT